MCNVATSSTLFQSFNINSNNRYYLFILRNTTHKWLTNSLAGAYIEEDFEDTNEVTRIRRSRDRQRNGQKKRIRTPLKPGNELMCSGRVGWTTVIYIVIQYPYELCGEPNLFIYILYIYLLLFAIVNRNMYLKYITPQKSLNIRNE